MSALSQPTKRLYTAEEFAALPDDGRRLELIEGVIVELPPPPGAEHGFRGSRLATLAGAYVYEHDLGECALAETGFIIRRGPDTTIGPDWAFVSRDRVPHPLPKGHAPFVPDLILEVRSSSDSKPAFQRRLQRWLDAGVRLVWGLDPLEQVLFVQRPGEPQRILQPEDLLSGEDVLPGFELPLDRVFR